MIKPPLCIDTGFYAMPVQQGDNYLGQLRGAGRGVDGAEQFVGKTAEIIDE